MKGDIGRPEQGAGLRTEQDTPVQETLLFHEENNKNKKSIKRNTSYDTYSTFLLSVEPWAAANSVAVPPDSSRIRSRFIAKGNLHRVSRQSRRSLVIWVIMK